MRTRKNFTPEQRIEAQESIERKRFRDYCAIAAMQAYISHSGVDSNQDKEVISLMSYKMANSMLAQRNSGDETEWAT